MADVRYKIFGDAASAERAYASLEARTAKLEARQRAAANNSKRRSTRATGFLKGQIGLLGKMALGYVGVQKAAQLASAAIRAIAEENRKVSRTIDDLIDKLPETELKLQIQSGLSGAALEQKVANVSPTAAQDPTHRTSQPKESHRSAARHSPPFAPTPRRTAPIESAA